MASTRHGELRAAFDLFDKDGDGRITATELAEVISSLSGGRTDEAQAMIAAVDVDKNGTVEFDEFEKCLVRFMPDRLDTQPDAPSREDVQEHWRGVFKAFDTNQDGMISVSELFEMMKKFGDSVSMQDAAEMHKSVDTNGDGQIDFAEFQAMMKSA